MCPTKLHPSQIHADLPGIFEEHVHLRLPYHYAVVKVQGGILPRHQQPNLTKVTSQCQPGWLGFASERISAPVLLTAEFSCLLSLAE